MTYSYTYIPVSRLRSLCISLFVHHDLDQDGFISLGELLGGYIQLLGQHVHKSQVPEVFSMINVSKTGLITVNELFNWYYIQAGLHIDFDQGYEVSLSPASGSPFGIKFMKSSQTTSDASKDLI